MKTATIPPVCVEPEFRADVESLPVEGESLSHCIEALVRVGAEHQRVPVEFIARGLRSRGDGGSAGGYTDADDVVAAPHRRLEAERARVCTIRR